LIGFLFTHGCLLSQAIRHESNFISQIPDRASLAYSLGGPKLSLGAVAMSFGTRMMQRNRKWLASVSTVLRGAQPAIAAATLVAAHKREPPLTRKNLIRG
jgi:hypothetical protein